MVIKQKERLKRQALQQVTNKSIDLIHTNLRIIAAKLPSNKIQEI